MTIILHRHPNIIIISVVGVRSSLIFSSLFQQNSDTGTTLQIPSRTKWKPRMDVMCNAKTSLRVEYRYLRRQCSPTVFSVATTHPNRWYGCISWDACIFFERQHFFQPYNSSPDSILLSSQQQQQHTIQETMPADVPYHYRRGKVAKELKSLKQKQQIRADFLQILLLDEENDKVLSVAELDQKHKVHGSNHLSSSRWWWW